jgi:uncharacterized protein (PEP-CTERM system associated)
MAMAFAMPAQAVEWRIEPSVGASVIYSDNASQSETDPQDQLSLTVSPGVTVQSEGSRQVKATLQYRMQGVARFGGEDGNDSEDLYHYLNAAGKAELVEDFLFIDADARISQELISLLGSPADPAVNASNRATTGSYSISPYIKKRFGTFADAEARYTLSGALFEEKAASDLSGNEFIASLGSGSRFGNLNWGLNYSFRDVSDRDADIGGDTSYTYERADLSLGYALTRKFRLIGNVGNEWIEYDSALAAANNRDDSLWSAGFAWSPSRRTSIEATMGQRFFGDTASLSASYRARESVWTASYVEDVNDISQTTLTEGTVYVWLCDGKFIITAFAIEPAPGCTLVGTIDALIPSLAEGLYVSKTLRAGVNWGIGKVSYSVNVFDITRSYLLLDEAEDRSQGVSAGMGYRLSPLTDLHGHLNWTRNQVPALLSGVGIDRDDDLYSFIVGVNHKFGRDLTGALTYRYYRRDSSDLTAEYTENNIMASVSMRF